MYAQVDMQIACGNKDCEQYQQLFYFPYINLEPVKPDPKPSKWRRVEDELPTNDRNVIVKIAESDQLFTAWIDRCKEWQIPCSTDHVTHWRELPKPPKKERTK
jgi:hypothetical protein